MKKTKQLAAVLLSLVMLLVLVIPASAAVNYSITIQNNKEGHTYEAYQIFAGTVSSDDPTAGNVQGPMLGDITLAEPGALIGFAGPRVIEQTIGEKLPEGFQRAEYLEEHGFVDQVVPRGQLREFLSRLLMLHTREEERDRG